MSKKILNVGCLIACLFVPSLCFGGWVKNITGGRVSTPPAIQKIAPNGIRILPRTDGNNGSALAVITCYIDDGGQVWFSGNSNDNLTVIARLNPSYPYNDGRAYFIHSEASNSPKRAGQFDKRPPVQQQQQQPPQQNYPQQHQVYYPPQQIYPQQQQVYYPPQQYYYPQQQQQNQQAQFQQQLQQNPGAMITLGILQALQNGAQNNQYQRTRGW